MSSQGARGSEDRATRKLVAFDEDPFKVILASVLDRTLSGESLTETCESGLRNVFLSHKMLHATVNVVRNDESGSVGSR